jgi:hypothetical protein
MGKSVGILWMCGGPRNAKGGMGVCGEGDGDDGAEVDAWRFVGYGRGGIWKRNGCHDGLTKERTLGYRAWGSTLGFRGSILGVTSLWEMWLLRVLWIFA